MELNRGEVEARAESLSMYSRRDFASINEDDAFARRDTLNPGFTTFFYEVVLTSNFVRLHKTCNSR